MNWKAKAAIQNAIAALPRPVSYAAYYRMQRLVGGLRRLNPVEHLTAGIETWRRILEAGSVPANKVFFEVGTGHVPIVPLAYWLMGARRTITIDVNPYLKSELVRETLDYIETHGVDVARLFGNLLQPDRMEALRRFSARRVCSLKDFLSACCIDYVEPGDAAKTGLPSESIDFHTSYTVVEHIPPEVLAQILEEGNRIITKDGFFVHMVDYSDHFSHSDSTISSINFLRYSDAEWSRYAGNRYMYMNRLRHDDALALFAAAGHEILSVTPTVDERSKELLKTGCLPLNERFAGKSFEILSIRNSWIVSRTRRSTENDRLHAEGPAVHARA